MAGSWDGLINNDLNGCLTFFSIFQASGVAVSQECKTTFDEVKQKRLHRYVVYHIEDEKMIKIEKIGAR